jgi:hypothetical protein
MTPDATAVVTAVRAVLNTQLAWQGTATELLHALAAADGTLALPANGNAMAVRLRRMVPALLEGGISVSFVRSGHAGTRIVHLALADNIPTDDGAAKAVADDAASRTADNRVADNSVAAAGHVTPTDKSVADYTDALTQTAPPTFEQRITRWLDDHPEPSEPGRCAYCGETETRARPVVPFGTDPGTHTWLHSGCLRAWRGQRRFRAVMAVGGGKLPG